MSPYGGYAGRCTVITTLTRLRQFFCAHRFFLDDLTPRDSEGMVSAVCHKCGKSCSSDCGLNLPGRWDGYKRPATVVESRVQG